jgi:guanine deaminase
MPIVLRASLLDFTADPSHVTGAVRWIDDGLVVIDNGRIAACGEYAALMPTLPPRPADR